MRFSICVPNYNYGQYIGETLESVLVQNADFEIIVADNCSTDDSIEVIRALDDPRIELRQNARNVGFAGNLDRATRGASGERMILLSSDDLAQPEALGTYARLSGLLGDRARRAIFASGQYIIDGEGNRTGQMGAEKRLWRSASKDEAISERLGAAVIRCDAGALLRNSLLELRTPFAFATTCYPRSLYEELEGYGGGPLINPDKFFAWRLLSRADDAFFIDAPLFAYRIHENNQAAIQRQSGALKHLMDQYRATFDLDCSVLAAAGLARRELEHAFIEHDIALRGLKMVAEGERVLARRGLDFGKAAYPELVRKSRKITLLRALLALGPAGSALARLRLDKALGEFRDRKSVV